jgi:hypothetical protein
MLSSCHEPASTVAMPAQVSEHGTITTDGMVSKQRQALVSSKHTQLLATL